MRLYIGYFRTHIESASPRARRLTLASKIVRDTKTAVNKFAIKPKVKVMAKPFTGPEPKMNRIAAETTVVTCVSTIVVQA